MVIFAIVGCSKRSGRDKDVFSFHIFPAVSSYGGKDDFKLRKNRKAGYLVEVHRYIYIYISIGIGTSNISSIFYR